MYVLTLLNLEYIFWLNNELFVFPLLALSDNIHNNVGVFVYIHSGFLNGT